MSFFHVLRQKFDLGYADIVLLSEESDKSQVFLDYLNDKVVIWGKLWAPKARNAFKELHCLEAKLCFSEEVRSRSVLLPDQFSMTW